MKNPLIFFALAIFLCHMVGKTRIHGKCLVVGHQFVAQHWKYHSAKMGGDEFIPDTWWVQIEGLDDWGDREKQTEWRSVPQSFYDHSKDHESELLIP